MATLAERQAAERKSLERLSDALDKRAHDLESLIQVLAAARDFSSFDPVEHVRAALRHYVREQPTQSIWHRVSEPPEYEPLDGISRPFVMWWGPDAVAPEPVWADQIGTLGYHVGWWCRVSDLPKPGAGNE